MLPVSARLIAALAKPQKRVTKVTYTTPGGAEVSLRFKRGSINMDSTSRIRRRGTVRVYDEQVDFSDVTTPGTIFRVQHGLTFAGVAEPETPYVICGVLNKATAPLGGKAGELTLPLVDLASWVEECRFVEPYAPADGTTRIAAIQAIVAAALPTVTFQVTATDTGTVQSGQLFTGSRLDAISTLTSDGGTEAFFLADGTYLIRNQASFTDTPAMTVRGLLIDGENYRERPMDKTYNMVVATPSASDGSQTWTQQVAKITDTTDPRHESKIGPRPYFLPMPTAKTEAAALHGAQARLERLKGTAENLSLAIVGNPALEGGDMLVIVVPAVGDEPARTYRHMLDAASLDLNTGKMPLDTRSQEVSY